LVCHKVRFINRISTSYYIILFYFILLNIWHTINTQSIETKWRLRVYVCRWMSNIANTNKTITLKLRRSCTKLFASFQNILIYSKPNTCQITIVCGLFVHCFEHASGRILKHSTSSWCFIIIYVHLSFQGNTNIESFTLVRNITRHLCNTYIRHSDVWLFKKNEIKSKY